MVHNAVPELDLKDISTCVSFLGKELRLPLIIEAMTGGIERAVAINQQLAEVAAAQGVGMAVGSQTIALKEKGCEESFSIVRKTNRNGLVLANVSANAKLEHALAAVEMVEADGLQLHFNVPQELAMKEGDRSFKGILDNVEKIVNKCGVPVIAKEVGFGFSREACRSLFARGVRILDVGGKGGTNFLAIEKARGGLLGDEFMSWGIPTAVSVAETVSVGLPITIIASGGIKDGLDAAKALTIGADLVGVAGQFLRTLLTKGKKALEKEIEQFGYALKCCLLMVGASNPQEMKKVPCVIKGQTAEWLTARGLDVRVWGTRVTPI